MRRATTEQMNPFDSLLKGAVFTLGGLFLAYCILHSLFGPWWSLQIARVFVVLILAGMVVMGTIGMVRKITVEKHLTRARIRKAYASCDIAVIQDPKGTQVITYDAKTSGFKQFFKPGNAKLYDRMAAANGGTWEATVGQDGAKETEPEPMPDAMGYIVDSQSLILLGPMGNGKTTLMSHLIDARAAEGDMIAVADPHGYEGKYPGVESILGAGRDYNQIDAFFLGMLEEMNRRYREYNGRNRWTPISIFVDEFTLIGRHVDSAEKFVESSLTEFRKCSFRIVLALHSRRSKYLRLKGGMDLTEGVDYCRLMKTRKERWAELELAGHDEIIHAALPGPYRGGRGGSPGRHGGPSGHGPTGPTPQGDTDTGTPHRNADMGDKWPFSGGVSGVGVYPLPHHPGAGPYVYEGPERREIFEADDARTAAIIRLYRAGCSITDICKQVFGVKGGRQTKRIRAVLERYGIA